MRFFTALAAVAGALLSTRTAEAAYCDSISPPVPACEDTSPRDLLFLVDGSQSMDRNRFYGEMLDYCLSLYCAFDPTQPNQAGLLVFAEQITVYIPLAEYTQDQWEAQVNTVRATRNTTTPACCSCCTPTADAFDAAVEEFNANGKNALSIAFMITDGVPSNNNPNTGGNPAWWFYNPVQGFNPAFYNMRIVPERAAVLRNAGHRLFLVGVPNVNNVPPDQNYFNGGYTSGTNICLTRQQTQFCDRYNKPPFPLVSLPVNKNSFSTTSWNVSSLISLTVGAVCEILPTPEPTRSPTKRPVIRPTSLAPSRSPTLSPTKPVIEQLDMTFLVDRSTSMIWHDAVCQKITNSFGPKAVPSTSACWELFMRYVLAQADELVKMPAGPNGNRQLGWASDFVGSSPPKGLRVNVIGFACTNNQRTPRVFHYSSEIAGGPITSRQGLFDLLENLRTEVMPEGGTCPGLAIEGAVRQIESTNARAYPLQSVILLTDGIFYDMPFPVRATKGLAAYEALRFSVGIAIADSQFSYGLTPAERELQQEQLTAFASKPELFKNLDATGWETLDQVATAIAQEFPAYYVYGNPMPRYTWCGWRRRSNCASNNWRNGNCYWKSKNIKEWGCARRRKSG